MSLFNPPKTYKVTRYIFLGGTVTIGKHLTEVEAIKLKDKLRETADSYTIINMREETLEES